jgi:multiple sugar transport system substrate-binding protein
MYVYPLFRLILSFLLAGALASAASCRSNEDQGLPTLTWYVFDEPSGAFQEAAEHCSKNSAGRYAIALKPLPTDADLQREQLVRRLAARDPNIDIIGMDVIWTAEFAEAGWILPWPEPLKEHVLTDRLPAAIETTRYQNQLWAIPFTSNAQLL